MDLNKSTQLPHMPQPFSYQRATPPNSRSATPDPFDEALEESLWMKGKEKGNKRECHSHRRKQDSSPGSSERAPPPPPPRQHGGHSSTSTPVPLDVNEMACSLTVDPGDVSTAAQMAAAGVEGLTLSGERTPGHLSHASMCNKSGEQSRKKFTFMSEIPVDRLGTECFRNSFQDALSTSDQWPTSFAESSQRNQGQSPAEFQGKARTVRVDETPDSEAQREFIELWKRKQEGKDTLEYMNAPDAAALEELRSALSIHSRRPAPGTPQGDNVVAQDRLEPDPQRITRSVTRVASPTSETRYDDLEVPDCPDRNGLVDYEGSVKSPAEVASGPNDSESRRIDATELGNADFQLGLFGPIVPARDDSNDENHNCCATAAPVEASHSQVVTMDVFPMFPNTCTFEDLFKRPKTLKSAEKSWGPYFKTSDIPEDVDIDNCGSSAIEDRVEGPRINASDLLNADIPYDLFGPIVPARDNSNRGNGGA